jgi:hypothetical protein
MCESEIAAVFSAIYQLGSQDITLTQTGEEPRIVVISATASADLWRSLSWPWIMAPLYAWVFSGPQTDNLNMEKLVRSDEGSPIRSFVIIRPAFLTDEAERGVESVRMRWEWYVDEPERKEKGSSPAKGWTLSRKDLGAWVFCKAVVEGGWERRFVRLCCQGVLMIWHSSCSQACPFCCTLRVPWWLFNVIALNVSSFAGER